METAVELTKNNTGLTLCLAFDYGGRDEIVQAARRLSSEGVPDENIDETVVSQYLYTAGIPDPDLIIRTGGEVRLSNFLLWQAAYSELHFTTVLWPDFGRREIEEALSEYERRPAPLRQCMSYELDSLEPIKENLRGACSRQIRFGSGTKETSIRKLDKHC